MSLTPHGHPEPEPAPEPGPPEPLPPIEPVPGPPEPPHAGHEKPGEWHAELPEHLAREHSPPAGARHPGWDAPTEHVEHPAWKIPLLPEGADRPRRRRRRLWVGAALGVVLLLCGGGARSAYLLIRNGDTGKGAPDPATAVDRFLTAVYTQQDADSADDLVCRAARDKARLQSRVDQVRGYSDEYDNPTFRWNDPAVTGQTDDQATVTVQLMMSTADEKAASQQLTFTVVHRTGWLVCEIAG